MFVRNLLALTRIILGLVFILSGGSKLLAPIEEFEAVIREYAFLPIDLVRPFAFTLPIAEVFVGTLMVFGLFERLAALGTTLMLLSFVIAISAALARGIDLKNCGCIGGLSLGETPREVLLRDWLMLLVSVLLIAHPPKRWSLDGLL